MPRRIDATPKRRSAVLRLLEKTGRGVIGSGRSLVLTVSTGTAVLIQGVRPLTWRRTVRHEFIHQCDLIGLKSIPFTVVIGGAFGLGFVYQLL
jgi:ABC-type transporter Mla maintaining outer membrane lipid asymmetry permease subunit MlaE